MVAALLEDIYGSVPLILPGIDVELRQTRRGTRSGTVLYEEDHPSHWMMKGGDTATFEHFKDTMEIMAGPHQLHPEWRGL